MFCSTESECEAVAPFLKCLMNLRQVSVFAELVSSPKGEDTKRKLFTVCLDDKALKTNEKKSNRLSPEAEFNKICPTIVEYLMPFVKYEAKKLLDKSSYEDLFRTGTTTLSIPPIRIRISGPSKLCK